jgi:hypothetical protein
MQGETYEVVLRGAAYSVRVGRGSSSSGSGDDAGLEVGVRDAVVTGDAWAAVVP